MVVLAAGYFKREQPAAVVRMNMPGKLGAGKRRNGSGENRLELFYSVRFLPPVSCC